MTSHIEGQSIDGVQTKLDHTSQYLRTTLHSTLPLTWRGDSPALPTHTEWQRRQLPLKRSLDVIVSGSALLLLAPILVIIALATALGSKGGVLFRQARLGKDGHLFTIYKFRTMYVERGDLTGVNQTIDGDPRVTPLGRYLRRTSLDELPQLINILKGDMSLVGPRPHVPHMLAGGKAYEQLVPYYDLRLRVRPGLSGWAQVNNLRGATTDPVRARARIDHDLAYAQNFSIWLDVKIVWMTISQEWWRLGGH
ncbi:MAG: exopolysaccharide production protein [Devosia sp.]|jgi:lipopolysaccharide/colanic/teichoic acid biosynthesis glycosyltransferase|nr:exopolysaccharide production protein [Devosia sp.]